MRLRSIFSCPLVGLACGCLSFPNLRAPSDNPMFAGKTWGFSVPEHFRIQKVILY